MRPSRLLPGLALLLFGLATACQSATPRTIPTLGPPDPPTLLPRVVPPTPIPAPTLAEPIGGPTVEALVAVTADMPTAEPAPVSVAPTSVTAVPTAEAKPTKQASSARPG